MRCIQALGQPLVQCNLLLLVLWVLMLMITSNNLLKWVWFPPCDRELEAQKILYEPLQIGTGYGCMGGVEWIIF